jgi:flagellar basal-body rod protein FlgB
MNMVSDPVIELLARAGELRMQRAQLLAGNIANADTPGYTPREMDFRQALELEKQGLALAVTDEKHLPVVTPAGGEPVVYEKPDGLPGLDGNTVGLESQMTKLTENRIHYEAGLAALRKKLALLRYAAGEGGM